MSNKFFYYNNVSLSTTTITADNEDVFYPVSNLQHDQTVKEYRMNDGYTDGYIYFDFGVSTTCDSLLFCGNSATGDLNVTDFKLQASPTNNYSTTSYDSGDIVISSDQLDEIFVHHSFTSTASRYWRLYVANTGGSNNFAGLSNVFLGQAFTMASNAIAIGFEFQRLDLSTVQTGRYGQRYIDRINDQKRLTCSIELLDKDEFEDIDNMTQYCGVHKPVWLVVDPNEVIVNNANIYSGYFYFTDRPSFSNIAFGLMSTQFNLIEVI